MFLGTAYKAMNRAAVLKDFSVQSYFLCILKATHRDPYIKAKKGNFPFIFSIFFADFLGPKGGCASSRLDHGLKTHPGRLR